jgi:hypothetical protein
MSRFYAEIQGHRGLASRQGHPSSGIWGHIRGWHVGVKVCGSILAEEDTDVFYVYATRGSSGGFNDKLVGKIKLVDGEPTWIPAK